MKEIRKKEIQKVEIRQKETFVKKNRPNINNRKLLRSHQTQPAKPPHLLVTVAVRPSKRIHQVTKHRALGNKAERQGVLERHGVAAIEVVGAVDLVLAGLAVHVLPDGPDAVDHGVVDVEDGVVGGRVEVLELRGAAADPVAAAVHAELVVADVALHQALEVLDGVLADDEVGYFPKNMLVRLFGNGNRNC
jgi:hypothetical protein